METRFERFLGVSVKNFWKFAMKTTIKFHITKTKHFKMIEKDTTVELIMWHVSKQR